VAIPLLLVTPVKAPKPSTEESVDAKETEAPCIANPATSLTVALNVTLEPPTTTGNAPKDGNATVAPTTLTSLVAGLAEQALQEAVNVTDRFD
jgi:hypothetical protein